MKPISSIKAVGKNVFIIRDEIENEKDGLLIPTVGKVNPHTGIVFSVGSLVADKDLKKGIGKRALFHQTTGQSIQYNGDEFVVLVEEHILGLDEVNQQ